MASAVYSEPPASRLSISLEGSASASPFPSPSSSFLPPPTPGAHEFAVKPVPPARNGRKSSTANISSSQPTSRDADCDDPVSPPETKTPSQRSSLNVQATNGSSHLITSKDYSIPMPSPTLISPMTPTPSSIQRKYLEPPRSPGHDQSNSTSTTPTTQTAALPPEDDTATDGPTEPLSKIYIPDALEASTPGSGPSSPAFSTSSRPMSSSINADPSLFSNRPAPPSPASRRVSGAPSMASTRSRSSRPPSTSVSRTSSLRKSISKSARGSPVINPHRQSLSNQLNQNLAQLPSPQNLSFSLNTQPSASTSAVTTAASGGVPASIPATPSAAQKRASSVVYIKIRDFGFPPSDERHMGLGADVPKPNRVGRMNRRLGGRTLSQGSMESSDGDGEEEDEDEGWGNSSVGGGWDGFRMGLGRFNWNIGAGNTAASVMEQEKAEAAFPSRMDLDMNFLVGDNALEQDEDDEEEEYFDAVPNGDEEEEDTLYPGLYRALYAFEPEGIAEMRLEEDQIVRVVGRGGGVGWAVVIDDQGTSSLPEGAEEESGGEQAALKHSLVPESYLEPVKLDWEDEEAAVAASSAPTPAHPDAASTGA